MNNGIQTIKPPALRERFLQASPYESDGGHLIGRDPREIAAEEWQGVERLTGLQAIRAKCLDCVPNAAEVRKCVAVDCPLWPYRMGAVPRGLRQAEAERNRDDQPDSEAPDAFAGADLPLGLDPGFGDGLAGA